MDFNLSEEGNNIRVISGNQNVILFNQDVETVSSLINHNFEIVNSFYKNPSLLSEDISDISMAIVLYYLYMYNSWRRLYKDQENKELKFDEEDFSHPATHDIIFSYFKTKYPKDWEDKSAVLLGIGLDELKAYYKTREAYYNK